MEKDEFDVGKIRLRRHVVRSADETGTAVRADLLDAKVACVRTSRPHGAPSVDEQFVLVVAGCDSGSSTTGGGGSKASLAAKVEKGDPAAMKALAKKGSDAVPTLQAMLAKDTNQAVSMAAMTIKQMGVSGDELLPNLLEAYGKHPGNPYVKQALMERRKSAIPAIVAILKGNDVKLQALAADLLNSLHKIIQSDAPDKTKIEAMGAIASIGVIADARARPILAEIAAGGGKVGTQATRVIKRLDSAEVMRKIRAEEAGN